MLGSRGNKSPRARRVWILVAALIVAVACGQSGDSEGQGGPPDHAGGPPGHEGQGGPPDHAGGPPGHEGQGGPPDHAGGPPDHEGGPPNHESGDQGHPPFGQHDGEHGPPTGEHEGMGGGSMMNEGPGNERGPPPTCTSEQTQSALEASSAYVQCTEVDYETFMTLVHADVDVLQGASTCFAEKVQETEETAEPDENGEVVIEVDEVFAECIQEVEDADDTKATAATADFLNKLIGSDSKICSCLPSFVEKTPDCDMWMRYRHFAMHLEDLCEAVDSAVENAAMPGIVELEAANQTENQDEAFEAVPQGNTKGSNGVMDQHPFGPCPPGQETHPEDPTKCQTSENQETYFNEHESSGGRGPPPEGQGSIFGALMSVVGVVALAGVVGVGGLWAWGKFHGGARQPGVRYMAANVDNDIGTELGPFGREYA